MDHFFLLNGDYHVAAVIPKGGVEVPRLPVAGESWDAVTGEFVLNDGVAADLDFSDEHRSEVHMIKAVEAAVVLSGIALSQGFLAEEAKALGVNIEVLAQKVHDQREPQREAEVRRRVRKSG
jgi:hypothetical protein